MKCWIFDDQYGKKLYEDMKSLYSFLEYPIKDNIKTPLDYIDKIENWDLILLDNYRTKEEAYARILSKIDDLEKEGKEVPASLQEEYEKANEAATQAAVALGTYEDEHSKDIEEYKQLAGVE